jgi:ABC-2 type transport system permease protein
MTASAIPDPLGRTPAADVLAPTRPYYWSVRRELWEYRSIYIAPLAAAGVALLGYFIVLMRLPHTMRTLGAFDPMSPPESITQPYHLGAAAVMGTAFILSIFYSLDCLYGERRDRSILFWKSLPVSDCTTVLAKVSVPLLVLPAIALVLTAFVGLIMLLLGSLVVAGSGLSVAAYWSMVQPFASFLALTYHIVTVHMLWYAPLYAWLLLISAWSRRTPFLWAALPPVVLIYFEKIAFHSSYFANFLGDRVGGSHEATSSMGDMPIAPGMHYTLGLFLASPGLWLGLLCAGLFLFAATRIRRQRSPI